MTFSFFFSSPPYPPLQGTRPTRKSQFNDKKGGPLFLLHPAKGSSSRGENDERRRFRDTRASEPCSRGRNTTLQTPRLLPRATRIHGRADQRGRIASDTDQRVMSVQQLIPYRRPSLCTLGPPVATASTPTRLLGSRGGMSARRRVGRWRGTAAMGEPAPSAAHCQ